MTEPTPPAAPPVPRKRAVAGPLRVLLAALVLAVGLLLTSARGLSMLLHGLLPTLTYSAIDGSVLDGMELRDARYTSPALNAQATRLALRWRASLRGGLVLREVQADELTLDIAAHEAAARPAWPSLPFKVRVEGLVIDGLSVTRGATHHRFTRLDAALSLTGRHWELSQFALRDPQQQVTGHARYDGTLDAAFEWQGPLAEHDGRVQLSARGALHALAIELQLQTPWLATLRGEVDVLAATPRFKGAVDGRAPGIGVVSGNLEGGLDGVQLRLHLPLAAAPPALRDAQLDLDLARLGDALGGDLRWRLGDAQGAHGEGSLRLDAAGLTLALDSAAPWSAGLRARLLFEDGGPRLGARLRWHDLTLPGLTPPLTTRGALKLRGTLGDLFVEGDVTATDSALGAFAAHWRGRLAPQVLELGQLDSRVLTGRLRARGSVRWQEAVCARMTFDFASLDFAQVDARLASALDGIGRFHGCREAQDWQGGIAFEQLGGRWRGQAVQGRGEFEHASDASALRKLHVQLGANVLDAELELAPRLAGKFTLGAPDLAAILPSLAGRLDARGELGGTLKAPALNAHVQGASLSVGGWRAAALDGRVDVDAARVSASTLAVTLDAFAHGDTALGQLTLQGQGTAAAHSVSLALSGGALRAALGAEGAWSAARWSGTVTALHLEHERSGRWQLQGIAPLSLGQGRIALGPACLAQNGARLCATLPDSSARDGRAELRATGLPLSLARPWLPASMLPRGTLSAEATLDNVAGVWHGQGHARIARGSVRYRLAGHAEQVLPLHEAQADFQIDGERLRAQAALRLGEWLQLAGDLDAGLAAAAPLRGELLITVPDITWLEEFVPDMAGSEGGARWRTRLSGSRDAPRLDAHLEMTSGSLLFPRFGTTLAALEISARGAPDARIELTGQARMGEGTLFLTGEFNRHGVGGAHAQLHLRGEQLAIMRMPDMEADAAPELDVSIGPERFDVRGKVNWSRVQIHLPALPERAVATSPDEVLIDGVAGQDAPAQRHLWFVDTLSADLDFTLGDEVELSAAGLDAKLNGAVHWRKPRGDARGRGRGGLNIIDGHYKAYGQDLEIQRGALIFDGPIDNPALEVRAIRPELDVVAGVRVSGNLRAPKFALFAEPSLPDAEVLSYLVTGHALANASSGEAGVIARAALSLGADRAALVTSQLSNLFALDEFGINPGTTARTSSIVAGKRLTPKLTVRSEFNPFERVWSFFLNYKLSPRWSVEAQTGAGQGADVIYSVERDRLTGAAPLKSDPAPPPTSP